MSQTQGDIKIEGFNLSDGEANEGTDSTVEFGVDIVFNHPLVASSAFDNGKKSYTLYLRDYIKK